MIEPWEMDWGDTADWTDVAKIEPTIPALLAHAKSDHPSRDVLVTDERHFTYGEMEAQSALLARQLLAAGIGKGTRIGVLLPSDETFLITWMAITRIGAVAVTLSTLSTPEEIDRITRHADLHMLFAAARYLHHDYVDRIAKALPELAGQRPPYALTAAPYLRAIRFWGDPASVPAWADPAGLDVGAPVSAALLAAVEAEVHTSDPAGIIYTSGSTAEPKGVIHSQGNLVRQAMKIAASFKYRSDERVYAPMPFFWVGGLVTTALCVMAVGGTMLASAKTGAALLDFLEQEGTTALVVWPHMVRALAADPSFPGRRWKAMRGGVFYEALPKDKRPKDPGLMSNPLGMTETTGPYTVMQSNMPEDQRGSLGPLMRGTEARLVDTDTGQLIALAANGDYAADSDGAVGVLHLRADTMMLGMVKRERADVFTPDGWYVTGDLCSFRRGHLHYHGRADDLIKAAGANVSPREVEAVLAKFPGVASVNVAGVPDATRGAVVGALVIPEPGAVLDAETLRRESAKSLSSYKVPRVIVIMQASQVPTLASSKIDRRALAKILQEAHETAV